VNIAGADRDVGGVAGGGFNVTPVWHHVAYGGSAKDASVRCKFIVDSAPQAPTEQLDVQ
jgi:hypothetical protein